MFAVKHGVNATVKNLTIARGSANGIANAGTLSVVNSTVSGNAGPGIGNTGTLDVVNSTFSGNASAGGGGGIYNQGTAAVTNSILSGNGSNCSGAITDNGGNLADDGTCNFKPITNSQVVSTAALKLGSPGDNGGPTQTIALLPGSAARNIAPCRQFTDQRGNHRPAPGQIMCDSGAVESATAGAATIPLGSCDQTSLANAITAAGAGGLVQFTQDCTITLSSTITPSQDVTIDGNGHRVTLSGGDSVPVFLVSVGVTAALNDLTISNGRDSDSGAGILNIGTLTVTNSTISGNSTLFNGGGIFNDGPLTLVNSTISGNSASSGGGGIFNGGPLTIINSTISGNSASIADPAYSGGGIYGSHAVTLTNSILAGNTPRNCSLAITDSGGNLADDASCAFTQSSSKNGATGLNLGSLADNGGPTQTVALLPGSAARDVLPAVSCVDPQGFPLADQRGFPRLDEGESTCDSGAFESNPPRTSGITPDTAPQHSGFSITVSGTDFSAGSVVYLDTAAAPTHFVSSKLLTADISANLSAHTAQVTVVNNDTGAVATSNPQLLFVTNAYAGLVSTPSIGSGVNPNAAAFNNLTTGKASVSAKGSGFVAVALYAQNPGGPYFENSAGPFDVYVAPGNTFTSVTITSCINPLSSWGNAQAATELQWWNGRAWVRASNQYYEHLSGCTTIVVDATSTPSIAQLSGTPFVAAEVLPVVGVPGAQSVQYGDPLNFTVTTADVGTGHTLTLRASGLPNGLSFLDLGDGAGMASGTITAPAGSNSASFTANDGVSDSPAGTVAISVTPAPLTIAASNSTMIYGGAPPIITPSFSGLVAGDTAASEAAKATCSSSATAGSPVGTYPSSCTLADASYSLTAVPGTVTVSPAPLTITATSPSTTYGGTAPAVAPIYGGLVNGTTAPATPPTCGTTAGSSSPAGPYPTTCAGATDPNYSISYVAGTLTVNPAPLTIAADNKQMSYGGTLPPLTWTATFVNEDTAASLTAQPSCSTAAASSSAGGYEITCSGAADPNYTIGYAKGRLTIKPVPLTITASSPTVTYDGTVPTIAPSYGGFVNGDSATSLTTPPTCSSTAPSSGAAGRYTTGCSGAVDGNYAPIGYVGGTLTINPASQLISFGPLANHLLGDEPFTVSATGGGSGNPVTFSAGPIAVCAASGTNGQTITLVGVGTCIVTANQAGNASYTAASPVAQSLSAVYPPLYLALTVTGSPPGPVTTGSRVTVSFQLGNHTAATQSVSGALTLTYTGGRGSLSLPVPFAFTLAAGQTRSQDRSFTVTGYFPRGTYTVGVSARDGAGDTASRSVSLTIG